jgi:hypothetical protein
MAQEAHGNWVPQEPRPTAEELSERMALFIAENPIKTPSSLENSEANPLASAGQECLLTTLMQCALKRPKEFCKLAAAASLPATKRRRVATPQCNVVGGSI